MLIEKYIHKFIYGVIVNVNTIFNLKKSVKIGYFDDALV